MRNREITAFRDKEIRTMTQYVFRFCNVLYTISIYFPIPTIKGGSVILFFFFFFNIHSFIHLVVPRLSCDMQDLWLWHAGSSSLTRDWICVPCIGIVESKPLDHQGSPLIFRLQPQKVSKASLSVNIHVGRNLDPHIHEQFLNSSKVFHLILPWEGI